MSARADRPDHREGSPVSMHASAVLVGEAALLIRGEAGHGKTGLALALIDLAAGRGRFACLIGDDRVVLDVRGGRLRARPHPAIAGLVERRGLGLTPAPHEPGGRVVLVVDCLGEDPARLPEPEDLVAGIAASGSIVTLPRLAVRGGAEDAARVLAALDLFAAES